MQVTDYVVHILLNSCNTHNLLDIQVAKKFGCVIEERGPLSVTIENETKIIISSMVKEISCHIQQTTFTSDVFLIPLGKTHYNIVMFFSHINTCADPLVEILIFSKSSCDSHLNLYLLFFTGFLSLSLLLNFLRHSLPVVLEALFHLH